MDRHVNTAPTAPLTPQEWCRHALAAVAQRKLNAQEAGHLEMLLVYCIECDPAAEAFAPLLARFAADPRAGIAAAASLLLEAWHRIWTAEAATSPPLQEGLRTLGGLLDDAGAQAAYIAISPDGMHLQQRDSDGTLVARALDPLTLQQELAARTALRGQVAPADPTDPERYETRLRALGAELDNEPPQSYQLLVTRQTMAVAGSAGYDRTFTGAELSAILSALLDQRRDADEPARADDVAGQDAPARADDVALHLV
jgi:hypothetical protein